MSLRWKNKGSKIIDSLNKLKFWHISILSVTLFVSGIIVSGVLGLFDETGTITIINNTGKTIIELEVSGKSGSVKTSEVFYRVAPGQLVTFTALLKEADFSYIIKAILADGSHIKPLGNYGLCNHYSVILNKES